MLFVFALLAVLFIALKLAAHINWSWPAVLLPIWEPVLLSILVGLIFDDALGFSA